MKTFMRHPCGLLATLGLILGLQGAVRADEVVLKNGNKFRGEITVDLGDRIILKTLHGTITLKRKEIASIKPGPVVWAKKDPKAAPKKDGSSRTTRARTSRSKGRALPRRPLNAKKRNVRTRRAKPGG